MQDLNIEGTLKTFEVNCDASNGSIVIRGRSIPENSFDFFDPVFEWINQYIENPNSQTQLQFYVEYFNTASSKCILDILRIFEKVHLENKSSVNVTWHFEEEDEDMEYAGEDFKAVIEIPFKVQPVDRF